MSSETDLMQRFLELASDQQKQVHLRLCARALEVWEDFMASEGEIVYFDSVVGLRHTVDSALPRLALEAVHGGENRFNLDYRYREPITALQDADLELPDRVEFAYYALYNLFQKYVRTASIDSWLIVNQSLAALDETECRPALERALNGVEGRCFCCGDTRDGTADSL